MPRYGNFTTRAISNRVAYNIWKLEYGIQIQSTDSEVLYRRDHSVYKNLYNYFPDDEFD